MLVLRGQPTTGHFARSSYVGPRQAAVEDQLAGPNRPHSHSPLLFSYSPHLACYRFAAFGAAAWSALCFSQASYSGVPGRGGAPFGSPPHSGGMSASVVPILLAEQAATDSVAAN